MNADPRTSQDPDRFGTIDPFALVVALSFVPFLVKAIDYLLIGAYVPIAVFATLAVLVARGFWRGNASRRRAIRVWAVAIILWALARLGILVLFALTSVSEAAIEASFNLGFVLVSLAFLVLGFQFFRAAAADGPQNPADQAASPTTASRD